MSEACKIKGTAIFRFTFQVIMVISVSACSLLKEKKEPQIDFQTAVEKPLPPEKTEELLEEVGSNWFYGQGLGETALTAGTIIVFPPYAIYVLGNGILSLSGYEEIRVTDALPDQEKEQWNSAYNTVTSGPGRLTAAIAGKEFRGKEVAKEKINNIIKPQEEVAVAQVKVTETK